MSEFIKENMVEILDVSQEMEKIMDEKELGSSVGNYALMGLIFSDVYFKKSQPENKRITMEKLIENFLDQENLT